ncbi:hypothetical protein EJ05DRAFT_317947 [Pseudovirgaria hyperparasitica]|uniref:Uncharacterized protein n=1 Tax=Pseudovirgaria hyperparasitica TaxID=470096 RepID=A0A6A6WEH4_9PEZI|nr:uncharacterized protein EJ05DRAFT_317947 [Pseudovirgaria hyperparasitica]KAF2759987.1 hypothetical protein EJ05DRAFT_317947 [Pseudovirgaria hyperparasitica]
MKYIPKNNQHEFAGCEELVQEARVIEFGEQMTEDASQWLHMEQHATYEQTFPRNLSGEVSALGSDPHIPNSPEATRNDTIQLSSAEMLATSHNSVKPVGTRSSQGRSPCPEYQPEFVGCLRQHNRRKRYPTQVYHTRGPLLASHAHKSSSSSLGDSAAPRKTTDSPSLETQPQRNPIESLQEFLDWSEFNPGTTEVSAHLERNMLREVATNASSADTNDSDSIRSRTIAELLLSENSGPEASRTNSMTSLSSEAMRGSVPPAHILKSPGFLHSLTRIKRSWTRRSSTMGPVLRTTTDPVLKRPWEAVLRHRLGSILSKERRHTVHSSLELQPPEMPRIPPNSSLPTSRAPVMPLSRPKLASFYARYRESPLSPHSRPEDQLGMVEYLNETRMDTATCKDLQTRTYGIQQESMAPWNSTESVTETVTTAGQQQLGSSSPLLISKTASSGMFLTPSRGTEEGSPGAEDYFSAPLASSSEKHAHTSETSPHMLSQSISPTSDPLNTPFDLEHYLSRGGRPTFETPRPLLGPAVLAPVPLSAARTRSRTLEAREGLGERRMRRNMCAAYDVACMLRSGLSLETVKRSNQDGREAALDVKKDDIQLQESKKRGKLQRRRAMSF